MSKLHLWRAATRLEELVEPWTLKYLHPAFDGNAEAAGLLSLALGPEMRGFVALEMWRAEVPPEAFRAYLRSAWSHDCRSLIEAARTRRRLAHLFRYAAFPLPADLPERVKIWRGTASRTLEQAVRGYSWTTDRDVACAFARQAAAGAGSPLVVGSQVPRSDIMLFENGRAEREVVLVDPPPLAQVEATCEDGSGTRLLMKTA